MIVKARFDGRVFVPEQPVDLPVGTVVEIPINPTSDAQEVPNLLTQIAEIAERYPENPDLPEDYAAQIDHYLYGTPKRP